MRNSSRVAPIFTTWKRSSRRGRSTRHKREASAQQLVGFSTDEGVMLQQVALIVDESQVEALSDALLAAGALSVSIADADAERVSERPLFGEPGAAVALRAWPRSRISVLLPAGAEPQFVVQAAARALAIAPPPITEVCALE